MAVHADSVRGGLYWQLDTLSFHSSFHSTFHSSFHSTFHSIPPVPLHMIRGAAEAKQGFSNVLRQHCNCHQHLAQLSPHLWPLEFLSLSWCTSSHVLWGRAITCRDGHHDGQPSYKHHRGGGTAPYLVLDMCITTRGERNVEQMYMLVSRRGDKDEQEFEQARRELGLSLGINEQVVSSA